MSEEENATTTSTEVPATEETPVLPPEPTVVTVDTLLLQNALSKYARVIPTKAVRVVQGIRIAVTDDRLELLGTDLEVALHMTLPAGTVLTPASAVVADYKALLRAVKAIKDRHTRLALYGEYLIVSDTGTSTHVSSFGDVEDFPEPPRRMEMAACIATREDGIPAEQKQDTVKFEELKASLRKTAALEFQEFTVSADSLAPALQYVLPGVSKGDTRYALNGVYLKGNGRGGAEFVTSNTHVLYRHDVALTSGTLTDETGFIMHPKFSDWLSKNAAGGGALTLRTDPHAVFVEGDGFALSGRRIEGMFPRYRDVIPAQCRMPGRLVVRRREFLAALKAAQPHASAETHRMDLLPNAAGDGLILSAMRDGVTTFTREIPAASRKWLSESVNADFLLDFLAVHPGDTVTFCHDDATRTEGGNPFAVYDGERLFLSMPLNSTRKVTPEELEAYQTALSEPDQEFPGTPSSTPPPAAIMKRPPAFKAVVTRAKADPSYLSALLSALGIPAAAI